MASNGCSPSRGSAVGARPRERLITASTSDRELVEAIARGEPDAFAEVFRRHGSRVHGIAQRMCSERADDVTQEVFLRLWHEPARYDPSGGSLSAFLSMQTHGRAVDRLRRERARRARESTDVLRRTPRGVEVDEAALTRVVGDVVGAVLSTLTDSQRHAILLAYFGGHTYREVAQMLDRSEATVKSQIRRGLTRLRPLVQLRPSDAVGRAVGSYASGADDASGGGPGVG